MSTPIDEIEQETIALRNELHATLMAALEPIFKANRVRAGIEEPTP